MPRQIKAGEATAARRRVFGQIVSADGITPATGEAGGQPQVMINGAAFTNAGIGVLVHGGDGRYYAELDAATVLATGTWIETRYKSAGTAECPLDSVEVVAFDPVADVAAILGKLNAAGLVVTVAAVVPPGGGDFSLVCGDDYRAADGRALTWHVLTGLDLSAAQSLTLTIYDGLLESDGVALGASLAAAPFAGGFDLSAELTAAQTGTLTPRHGGAGGPPRYAALTDPRRRYSLGAVLSNGHVLTLASGYVTVTE